MKCYDVPSSATGTEYMLHGSCYWSSLILNDACCPSLPSSPCSEMWPQHTACTKPRGLHSSGMDILTLNYTIQLSKAGTHFSFPSARHNTADIMWSLCGKRQKLHLRSTALFLSGQPHQQPFRRLTRHLTSSPTWYFFSGFFIRMSARCMVGTRPLICLPIFTTIPCGFMVSTLP